MGMYSDINIFSFLSNKEQVSQKTYEIYVNKIKKENEEKGVAEQLQIISYDDFWRGKVLDSFIFVYDNDKVSSYCSKHCISLEYIYMIRELGDALFEYITYFTVDEYLKLREVLSGQVKVHNIWYVMPAIINGIFYTAKNPSLVYNTLRNLSEEKNSDGIKVIDWYPFSKLDKGKRVYKEINKMDIFAVIVELEKQINKSISSFTSRIFEFYIDDDSCSAFSLVEMFGIEELEKEINEKFNFLNNGTYSFLFSSILERKKMKENYYGKEINGVESAVIKDLIERIGRKKRNEEERKDRIGYGISSALLKQALERKRRRVVHTKKKSG